MSEIKVRVMPDWIPFEAEDGKPVGHVPQPFEVVLIAFDGKVAEAKYIADAAMFIKTCNTYPYINPSHWMPLPSPPENN